MSSAAMEIRDAASPYRAGADTQGVPPGYKRTKLGVIPEDWQTKRLGDLGQVVRGGSPRPAGDPRFFNGAFIPWLTVAALTSLPEHEIHVSETFSHLTEVGAKRSRTLDPGTLIVANSGATLGVAKILDLKCCANDGIAAIINQHSGNKRFLCYHINTQTDRLRDVVATGNGQPNLNTTLIAEILVPFPRPAEQVAIAEALSDVDGMLGALEALIAKKRAIKQAAMQQLLTGKTRLPGFSGEWETKRLGEVGEISGAGVDKKVRPHEVPVRLVNYLDVYHRTFLHANDLTHVVSARPDHAKRCMVQKGDVFFTPTSEVPDDIGRSAVAMENIQDGVYSYHVVRLRLTARWNLRFRAYAFATKPFLDEASRTCEGSGTRYVITLPRFRALTVRFPGDVYEQAAIATVLSDMDAEITALEGRRDKTRAIKQGMMQQLLTGRVRLVDPEAAA